MLTKSITSQQNIKLVKLLSNIGNLLVEIEDKIYIKVKNLFYLLKQLKYMPNNFEICFKYSIIFPLTRGV